MQLIQGNKAKRNTKQKLHFRTTISSSFWELYRVKHLSDN